MKLRFLITLAFAAAGCLFMGPNLGAGDKKDTDKKAETPKDVVINSELTNADIKDKILTESFCKTYTYKMIQGRTYQINLNSTAFDAYLRLEDPKGTQVAADDDSGGLLNSRIIYRPTITGDFTICAMSLGGGSTGKFMLIVKDTTIAAVKGPNDGKPFELKNDKGNAAVTSSLNKNDPLYKNKRHKLFLLNMEAGKTYQIDMTSTALDSYLFLEDPDQKLLAQNDDGGGFPNARIIHKATVTGKHRIVATYFGDGVGEFTLTIRQTDGAPPRDEKKDGKGK